MDRMTATNNTLSISLLLLRVRLEPSPLNAVFPLLTLSPGLSVLRIQLRPWMVLVSAKPRTRRPGEAGALGRRSFWVGIAPGNGRRGVKTPAFIGAVKVVRSPVSKKILNSTNETLNAFIK